MNLHEAVDVATVKLAALRLDRNLFATGLDAPPLVDVAADADASVDDVRVAGPHEVGVETPLGEFDAAYLPWRWRGPDAPTLLYLHGSGERPFDFGRLSSNSFRRLFVGHDRALPANVVAVRAPFHDRPTDEYLHEMGDLRNYVGTVAASAALVDELARAARERTDAPVVAAGLSLGGFALTLHRACFGGVDRYAPMLAGATLDEVFVSSAYRALVDEAARARPDRLAEVLDFEAEFRAVDADDCRPLLASHDRIVEFDRQRAGFEDHSVSVLEKGHVTGALSTTALREHVANAVAAVRETGGR